jgi:hypothetical protein
LYCFERSTASSWISVSHRQGGRCRLIANSCREEEADRFLRVLLTLRSFRLRLCFDTADQPFLSENIYSNNENIIF